MDSGTERDMQANCLCPRHSKRFCHRICKVSRHRTPGQTAAIWRSMTECAGGARTNYPTLYTSNVNCACSGAHVECGIVLLIVIQPCLKGTSTAMHWCTKKLIITTQSSRFATIVFRCVRVCANIVYSCVCVCACAIQYVARPLPPPREGHNAVPMTHIRWCYHAHERRRTGTLPVWYCPTMQHTGQAQGQTQDRHGAW